MPHRLTKSVVFSEWLLNLARIECYKSNWYYYRRKRINKLTEYPIFKQIFMLVAVKTHHIFGITTKKERWTETFKCR